MLFSALARLTEIEFQVPSLSVMNKAVIAAIYQCWQIFFSTFNPALLLETVIAAVDQGHSDTDNMGLMQLCINSQRLFFLLRSIF